MDDSVLIIVRYIPHSFFVDSSIAVGMTSATKFSTKKVMLVISSEPVDRSDNEG
jgi:hypothetical protein